MRHVQTVSGTGALRTAGDFCSKFLGESTPIFLPTPTWGNHAAIFEVRVFGVFMLAWGICLGAAELATACGMAALPPGFWLERSVLPVRWPCRSRRFVVAGLTRALFV